MTLKIQDTTPAETLRTEKAARVTARTQKLFEQFSATLANVLFELQAVQQSVVQTPQPVTPEKSARSEDEQKLPEAPVAAKAEDQSTAAAAENGVNISRAAQTQEPAKTTTSNSQADSAENAGDPAKSTDGQGDPAETTQQTAGEAVTAGESVAAESAPVAPAAAEEAAAAAVDEQPAEAAAATTAPADEAAVTPGAGSAVEKQVAGETKASKAQHQTAAESQASDTAATADTASDPVAVTPQPTAAAADGTAQTRETKEPSTSERILNEITQRLQGGAPAVNAGTSALTQAPARPHGAAEGERAVQGAQHAAQPDTAKGLLQSAAANNTPSFSAFGQHQEKKSETTEQTVRTRPQELPRMARLFEKVEEALKEVARSKDGKTISVIMEPQALGTVKVDVSLREGVLHARLVADSPQVAQLLRERAAELQSLLRGMGLQADHITVSVGGEGSMSSFDGMLNSSSQQQQQRQQSAFRALYGDEGSGVRGAAPLAAETTGTVADHWVA